MTFDSLDALRDTYVILLPNGCLLTVDGKSIGDSTRISDLKECVLQQATGLPLASTLKREKDNYIFVYIDKITGQIEQAIDESKFVKSTDIYSLTLKLSEITLDQLDRQLSVQIGKIIGKGLHEFDVLKDPQVDNARRRLANLTRRLSVNVDDDHSLSYYFPEKLLPQQLNLELIRHIFPDETFGIDVYDDSLSNHMQLRVSFSYTIHQLIHEIVSLPPFHCHLPHECYVLRVAGSQEYIYSDNFLIDYETIQLTLLRRESPKLILKEKSEIVLPLKSMASSLLEQPSTNEVTIFERDDANLCESITCNLSCAISEVCNLDASCENCEVAIKGAIFHGNCMLTECSSCVTVQIVDARKCTIDCELKFDISIANLTQVCKLCLLMIHLRSKSLIGWVNVTLFDFRNQLRQGTLTLPLWTSTSRQIDVTSDDFYSEGTTAPLDSSRDDLPSVTIAFPATAHKCIRFSKDAFVVPDHIDFAAESTDSNADDLDSQLVHLTNICNCMLTSFDLSPNEKKLFRLHREECAKYLADSLPLVLLSVQWNDRADTEQMFTLLSNWPKVKSSTCLALLTCHFPSIQVKIFALQTLYQLPQVELELLLLPIVQSTRNECFVFSATLQFLLQVALRNRHLGHKIVYLLRCEMQDETVCIPFGLLLETYMRCDHFFIASHIKCTEFIYKLDTLNQSMDLECETIEENKDDIKKRKVKLISEYLQLVDWQSLADGLTCWFDPRIVFGSINTSKCKVMHSKMKPLSLTFRRQLDTRLLSNDDIAVIFTRGGDMRRDNLILSLIKLLDFIWKKNGFDLHLRSYSCVPFTRHIGIIEAVQDSITIADIEADKRWRATSAFRKDCIYQWLITQNPDKESLDEAINRFTLSCAGYCVISYILGIADRHSDNMMITRNGQLFYIDFGHILGKFKAKSGINRERVPFVLTQEFVHVITRADTDADALAIFQEHCEDAFILARRHSLLIFNIFNLMLQSGLDEINVLADLDYLKTTLVTDLNEQEARKLFRIQFDESLKNGCKTNLNWFAHNLAEDNV